MRHYRAVIKLIAARRRRAGLLFPSLCLAGLATSSAAPALGATDGPDAGPLLEATILPAPAPSAPPAPAPTAPRPAAAPEARLTAQVGVRSLLLVQDQADPQELGDTTAGGEANVVLSGRVHRFLAWQAGFAGRLGLGSTTSATLLDLVAQIELAPSLNLWMGRMPIPADRASLSTVWAIAPWTLPGEAPSFVPAGDRPVTGLRRGELGRGDGVTLWGQLGGGRFKYYAGAFGLEQPARSPLYAARLALALLDPEPGYRTAASYFGGKRVLSLGAALQHRSDGSRPPAGSSAAPRDFDALTGDLLLELGNDATGVLDLEGAFTKVWGKLEAVAYQTFGLVSYLVPLEIGFGRFQPLIRVQRAGAGQGVDEGTITTLDTQLGYVVDGHRARAAVGWTYARARGRTENAILIGLQLLSPVR